MMFQIRKPLGKAVRKSMAFGAVAAFVCMVAAPASAAEKDSPAVSLFNGVDLTGWEGAPGWWKVEDGAITSESTPAKP